MEHIIKNTQVSFRTNSDLLVSAKKVFSDNNIDLTLALNEFLAKTVEDNSLPFAIYDSEAERVFNDLKAEMDAAYQNYLQGKYIPASEVEKKWEV